jgi:RimJ/RimL family protein N-acetyltransferase
MEFSQHLKKLESNIVKLEPFEAEHKTLLYDSALEDEGVFNHMFFGPFNSPDQFADYVKSKMNQSDSIAFSVFSKVQNRYVGSASILNIRTNHRVAEIGSVWFRKSAHRTESNSATVLLLLEYLFETQFFRRVEWKCDEKNESSKNSALRMGFTFEGTFRNHMLIKGRNRNTSWFSIVEEDWPALKEPLKERVHLKLRTSENSC